MSHLERCFYIAGQLMTHRSLWLSDRRFDEAFWIKAVPETAEKLMTKHTHLYHVNLPKKMSPSAESGNTAG